MERVYTTPLLDKLGIRPGMRVALIDIDDPEIRPLIAERTSDLTEGWPEPDTDVVLLGADACDALAPLEALATRIRPNGAIWVVSRKGKAATLRDVDVIDAARAPARRQQGRVVLADAHRAAPRHPGRPANLRPSYPPVDHPRCTIAHGLLIILIVVLVIVVVWRGPKTLPKWGEALGRASARPRPRRQGAGRDPGPRVGNEGRRPTATSRPEPIRRPPPSPEHPRPMTPDDLDRAHPSPGPGSHRTMIEIDGRQVETLDDLPPLRDRLLFVGLNPSPVSVAAGHYHQGRLGRTFWGG